jgi:hypothetical protein
VERLLAFYRIGSSVGAVIALLVANAIPLIGVLSFGWNVWTILIVYWLENGIVGVFNVLRMLKAEGPSDVSTGRMTMNGRPIDAGAKASLVPFFVLHYGIFWTVHGIFVLTLPVFGSMAPDGGPGADMTSGFDPATIALAVIALTISHGVSYYVNFLRRGEYRRVSAAGQMFAPYGRLVVLHLTIIVGGIAIATTGAPAAAIAILVVLKTVMDLGFHLTAHRKIAAAAPSPLSRDKAKMNEHEPSA